MLAFGGFFQWSLLTSQGGGGIGLALLGDESFPRSGCTVSDSAPLPNTASLPDEDGGDKKITDQPKRLRVIMEGFCSLFRFIAALLARER